MTAIALQDGREGELMNSLRFMKVQEVQEVQEEEMRELDKNKSKATEL